MTTVLAVSPHLDDAAFSAGGLLWRHARRGARVIVATVFTGNVAKPTGFALACQLDKGLDPGIDYMALRRAEDRDACALLGAEPLHLSFLEAPHRGYDDAAALFAGVRSDDRVEEQVSGRLAELCRDLRPGWILGPLGIGNHADHLIVRQALGSLKHPGTVWWEDWPYLDRDAHARGRRHHARQFPLTAAARAAKLAACAAYRSQLGFQFGSRKALASHLQRQTSEWFHPHRSPQSGDCHIAVAGP